MGCQESTTDNIMLDSISITISYADNPIYKGEHYDAFATWGPGWCNIVLTTGTYPGCLLHEMMHCIEGEWHSEQFNSEYCEDEI